MNFNSPILFPWWLKQAIFFLLDASIFTAIDEKKEEQKSTLQIFLKDVTEEKDLEIHQHSWLLIIWIFKILNFLKSISKTTFKTKLSSEQDL